MTDPDTPHHVVLDVWSDVRLADLLRTLPGVTVKPLGKQTDTVSLHDAADLRLVRSGVQLVRSSSADGDLWDLTVERSPFWHKDLGTSPVRWIAPADEMPDAVVGALRTAALTEVLVERTTSRSWSVIRTIGPDPDSDPASDPDPGVDDEAAAPVDDGSTGPEPTVNAEPRYLEAVVSLLDLAVLRSRRIASRRAQIVIEGDRSMVDEVAALVQAHGGESGEQGLSTLDVLGARAERPVVPVEVDDDSLGSLVRCALGRSVARLLANDVAVRLDLGPEAVHQCRVATRRLRSDLRTLRPVLEERWTNVIDRELRWIADLLGDLRDLDVLTERILQRVVDLAPDDQKVGAALLAVLAKERDIAADALHRAMASHRYARLLDGLVDAADAPAVIDPQRQATDVVVELVRDPWQSLRKKARKALDHGSPVDELHEVRIRSKRARYAFDVAAIVIHDAGAHTKRVAALQDELGELHDAAVAEEWLRSRATKHGIGGAFVIGMICAQERAEIVARRSAWVDAWERADGRKVTRWLR